MNRPFNIATAYGSFFALMAIAVCNAVVFAANTDLQYDIKAAQVVPYRVTIVAETLAETDTMSGVIAFTGKKSTDDGMVLAFKGGLTRKKQAKGGSGGTGRGPGGFPGRPLGGPPIPRSPMSPFGSGITFGGLTQTDNELVVGRNGDIKSLTGESQLPYLLGNLSLLPFEGLPSNTEKEWTSGNSISITEGTSARLPRGPFGRGQQETTTGGSESANYSILKDDGKRVTIQKTYRLYSPAATEDEETLEIKGTGTFVFNRELRLPESLDFKQDFAVSSTGSSMTIPMTVAWNRISLEEYQAHIDAREEQIAALREQAEQREAERRTAEATPLDPKQKNEILVELRSDNWARVTGRLGRLMSHKLHTNDADVALVIRDLQNHKNPGVSMRAKQLWKKWSAIVENPGSANAAGGTSTPTDNPFSPGKEDGRQMRTWSDSTGAFKVDAAFVKADGSNVVLRTESGKELNVPIDRLSTADKAIVEALKKGVELDNPFK